MHIPSIRLLLALLAVAAGLSLSACANRSKAPPQAAATTASPMPPEEARSSPVSPGSPVVVRPGSQADLAATAGERVYFAVDSYELSQEARATLDGQAAWLSRHPVPVLIEGNADERGTREYNLALGARRAEAVRQHLTGRGVASPLVRTISYGKERPLDPRSSEDGWAVNRNARTAVGGAP